ncbi:MAG: NADH-quinone oxidoreductase subunit N [Chitinophagaceae bacterium]|nr:NADH-quinone oxidoreductase subunit N [Chitinophagaceae bacterium]
MWNDILALLKQELIVTFIILILLTIKVGATEWKTDNILKLANLLLLINFMAGFVMNSEGTLFNDMFHTDRLITLEKNMLSLATLIISLQSYDWLKTHKHILEFYVLMLSTLLGMFFMISSGNLLIFYLGLELSTIPLAAIANFDLGKRQSSEAAFKLIISSAFSSGLLLFGISLVYGTTGSLSFEIIRQQLDGSSLQLYAFILLLSGFAFKISVVPFHLWTADVYEGAPVAVTSYLSVVSKGAIFFVFVPVLYTVFKSLAAHWYLMLFLLSILTMLIGNLFAIRQNNLKRLLAFSSISQVGFILVGISGSSTAGSASVIYFILIYIFSNLGAFGVVSLISALTGKETIEDYKGLYSTNPLLSWVLTISLFSLAGIPPTAGFFGKFFLLMAGAGHGNYELVIIAALNMVIALYYYLRVVKAIFMDSNEHPIEKLKISILPKLAMLACAGAIIITGFAGWIYDHISSLSTGF